MVRTYKRKTTRGSQTDIMQRAVEEVVKNKQSYRTVALAFGVDKMTLYRHCKKIKQSVIEESAEFFPKVICGYAKSRQIFSDSEESDLVKYLRDASKMFFGLSPNETRKLAYEFAISLHKPVPESWTSGQTAGRDWFSGFMRRHQSVLSVRTPEATSLSRMTSFNRTNVGLFYDNLEGLYKRFHFEPQSIWNADETGLTTAQNPGKIVAQRGTKQVGAVTSAERGKLVTLCCAVNALGHAMPPMFIFPRVRYHERLVDGGPPGCIGASHKSGWMTQENFQIFLKHFVKHSKASTDHPVLLLLDNHESHLSVDGIQFAKDNGVHLLSFPPHCSHRLQPLDCTVYYPLKRHYNAQCDSWCHSHPGRPMQPLDIPAVCASAFKSAMTPGNIQSGFQVTGIYPYDRNRIQDDEFLPSSVTDRPNPDTSSEVISESVTDNQTTSSASAPDLRTLSEEETYAPDTDPPLSTKPTDDMHNSLLSCDQELPTSADTSALNDTAPPPAEIQTPLTPSVLTAQHADIPTTPRSLFDIRPLPKAGPRVGSRPTVTRKRGRTRVLTDTPEKLLIEKEAAERKAAKATKTGSRSQRNEKKEKKEGKPKPKNKKKNKKDYEESEDEETFCLVCTEPYSNSRAREKWVQCTACHMWAHEACTDGNCSYICHNCDSDDDSF